MSFLKMAQSIAYFFPSMANAGSSRPHVGIAVNNIFQRNLIFFYLLFFLPRTFTSTKKPVKVTWRRTFAASDIGWALVGQD